MTEKRNQNDDISLNSRFGPKNGLLSNLGGGLRAAAFALLADAVAVIAGAQTLPSPVDIYIADSSATVLKIDASLGTLAVLGQGGLLRQPLGVAISPDGKWLYVTDTGCAAVIGIDLQTREQLVVASGGLLGVPFGIAVERDGHILVANAQYLVRINPNTRAQILVSSGGFFRAPLAVTVAPNGDIYVVDGLGAIIQVEPATGAQTLISQGGCLKRPQGIAIKGHYLYVTDVATSDGNFGVGCVVVIDSRTGEQTILSEGGSLVGPVGIAVEEDGHIIVGDPYTINPGSRDLFDGGIVGIERATGAQSLIARGYENFVNPRGVAVLKMPGSTDKPGLGR